MRSGLYIGPMKSGKSLALIALANKLTRSGLGVLAYKPSVDTRDGGFIRSRAIPDTVLAKVVSNPYGILDHAIRARAANCMQKVVLIDEIHLFQDKSVIDVIKTLLALDFRVFGASLKTDFRGEPFPLGSKTTLDLLGVFKHVFFLNGQCDLCGEPSECTQRLIDGEYAPYDSELIQVGDDEYQTRCTGCYIQPQINENTQLGIS